MTPTCKPLLLILTFLSILVHPVFSGNNDAELLATNAHLIGTIYDVHNQPLQGVEVNLSGFSTASQTTGSDGTYNFADLTENEDYTVTPMKTDDVADCLSGYDIILLQKHILGFSILSSNQLVAADVNNSGGLTTFDVVLIRQVILGNNAAFSSVDSYKFVPAFATEANLSTTETNDFVAIKMGDVSQCAETKQAGTVEIIAGNVQAQSGSTTVVGISVANFNNVIGLDFSITFDPAVLQFAQVSGINLPDLFSANFGTTQSVNGEITLSWFKPNLTGATLSNGIVIFNLEFQVVGAGSTSSPITISNAPLDFEVVDNNCDVFGLVAQNGMVTVTASPPDIELFSFDGSVHSTGNVCQPVRANNFNDIISAQFGIEWDEASLTYTDVENFGLPNMSSSNFLTTNVNNGSLSFSWVEPSFVGVTVPPNGILFEVCFNAIGAAGSSSMFSPVGIIEFSDNNGIVNNTSQNSTIDITQANIVLNGPTIPAGIIVAEQITASGTIETGSEVVFQYCDNVTLENNFTVESGATLVLEPVTCN